MKKISLAVVLLSFSLSVNAQTTRYISDDLEVPARAGAGDRFKITKSLRTGQKVTVMDTNKISGYSLVRVENGYQGWVYTRHLMDEPSARSYIEEAKNEYEPTRQKLIELEKNLEEAKVMQQQLLATIEALRAESKSKGEELADFKHVNANAIEIAEQNKSLMVTATDLKQRLGKEELDNQKLRSDVTSREQMIGAGIFGLGMFLGLVVIPRLASRKRKSSNSYS